MFVQAAFKSKKQKMDESKHRIIQVFKIMVKYFLLVNRKIIKQKYGRKVGQKYKTLCNY